MCERESSMRATKKDLTFWTVDFVKYIYPWQL